MPDVPTARRGSFGSESQVQSWHPKLGSWSDTGVLSQDLEVSSPRFQHLGLQQGLQGPRNPTVQILELKAYIPGFISPNSGVPGIDLGICSQMSTHQPDNSEFSSKSGGLDAKSWGPRSKYWGPCSKIMGFSFQILGSQGRMSGFQPQILRFKVRVLCFHGRSSGCRSQIGVPRSGVSEYLDPIAGCKRPRCRGAGPGSGAAMARLGSWPAEETGPERGGSAVAGRGAAGQL